ncbi:hypothetical protein PGB90_009791 [Kerria lacca]
MSITLQSHTESRQIENATTSAKETYKYSNLELLDGFKSSQIRNTDEKKNKIFDEKHEKERKELIYSNFQEYEPYNYCTSEKPTTYYDTLFHLLKVSVGTGIFALPSAFKDVGYIFGVAGIILIILLYTYCLHLLFQSEYVLCKRKRTPNMSYANIVYIAFKETLPKYHWLAISGKFFTNFSFVIYESGGCVIYIIFISSNLKQLLDYNLHDEISLQLIMFYVTCPMILVCWVRNLKFLAPLSVTANIILIVCFLLVFWYEFREIPTFEGKLAFAGLSEMPVYLNTILFAISSTGIILSLKSEMKHPAKFTSPTGVLNMAFIPLALLYAIFGFFGYLKYGNDIAGSVTLNLPQNELPAQIINSFSLLSVFISYYLCYYVVFDIVWKNYLKNKCKNNLILEYVARTLFPIIIFIIAYTIPNFKTFISLVGAFGICATSLVIPIVIHTLVFWNYYQTKTRFYIFLFKNMILLGISMFIFVSGILKSIIDVIELYQK